MSTKTMINIKTDSKLKAKAQKVARELGLPLGTIINRYLQTFVIDQRVTFERPEIPNAETKKAIEEARRDIETGKDMISFETSKEMDDYLMSL